MAEVAHAFGWSYTELMSMEVQELMAWHQQVARINKAMAGDPKR